MDDLFEDIKKLVSNMDKKKLYGDMEEEIVYDTDYDLNDINDGWVKSYILDEFIIRDIYKAIKSFDDTIKEHYEMYIVDEIYGGRKGGSGNMDRDIDNILDYTFDVGPLNLLCDALEPSCDSDELEELIRTGNIPVDAVVKAAIKAVNIIDNYYKKSWEIHGY